MKRAPVHLAFAGVCVALGATAVVLALRLNQAQAANAVIANATAAARLATLGSAADSAATAAAKPPPRLDTAEAALAFAVTLAKGEDYERALRALEPLSQSTRADIRQIARYDLGNLHMRQARRIGDQEVGKARTLVELAKQAYRRVLDENPGHWPSRYNLERALWLEPEADDGDVEVTPPPAVERPNGDKPELP